MQKKLFQGQYGVKIPYSIILKVKWNVANPCLFMSWECDFSQNTSDNIFHHVFVQIHQNLKGKMRDIQFITVAVLTSDSFLNTDKKMSNFTNCVSLLNHLGERENSNGSWKYKRQALLGDMVFHRRLRAAKTQAIKGQPKANWATKGRWRCTMWVSVSKWTGTAPPSTTQAQYIVKKMTIYGKLRDRDY